MSAHNSFYVNARAQGIMRKSLQEQRASLRLPVCLSGELTCSGGKTGALVRDMSESGVFCYANINPKLGDAVSLILTTPHGGSTRRVSCEGHVVRIVRFPTGDTVGIGIRVRQQDMF